MARSAFRRLDSEPIITCMGCDGLSVDQDDRQQEVN